MFYTRKKNLIGLDNFFANNSKLMVIRQDLTLGKLSGNNQVTWAVISVLWCPANFPRFSHCVANTIHIFEGEGWDSFQMDNDVNVLRTRD